MYCKRALGQIKLMTVMANNKIYMFTQAEATHGAKRKKLLEYPNIS